jgi:Holliday junction resolvase-like predicted endonuclease
MSFKLVKLTDEHMTRSTLGFPRQQNLYPSEASVRFTDPNGNVRVEGTCMRKAYFRYTGKKPDTEIDAYTQWIFALGKSVEEILVEQWKQMGIWVANNIKFYDPQHHVSGEIDVVLREPDTNTLFFVEVKSFYGYYATKELIGNRSTKAAPKTAHLLQTLIYLSQHKDTFPYGKIVYYARDSANRTEFDITLASEGGDYLPVVNGKIDSRFTVGDIYDRFDLLMDHIKDSVVPEADFRKEYTPKMVEERKALGEVSKTAYEKWLKDPRKNPIGDWQCRYCQYCKTCWRK